MTNSGKFWQNRIRAIDKALAASNCENRDDLIKERLLLRRRLTRLQRVEEHQRLLRMRVRASG